MPGMDEVIGKAISDEQFCGRLLKDPRAVLSAHGVDPTSEIIEAFKGLDAKMLQRLAIAFDKNKKSTA